MAYVLPALAPEMILVAAVAAVGVLHTVVPDHWVPIALLARAQRWSRRTTATAALRAGTGHVLSTLAIALVVWVAGVAFAARFGQAVSVISSLALIAFGGWIAVSSLREVRSGHHHSHDDHDHHDGQADAPLPAKPSSRTALLLILGSSPMVEGIPAFFAAVKYGVALLLVMAVVFAASTIATYVVLCVTSTAGLERIRFGRFEQYGEVLSGSFIAIVGAAFLAFPVL